MHTETPKTFLKLGNKLISSECDYCTQDEKNLLSLFHNARPKHLDDVDLIIDISHDEKYRAGYMIPNLSFFYTADKIVRYPLFCLVANSIDEIIYKLNQLHPPQDLTVITRVARIVDRILSLNLQGVLGDLVDKGYYAGYVKMKLSESSFITAVAEIDKFGAIYVKDFKIEGENTLDKEIDILLLNALRFVYDTALAYKDILSKYYAPTVNDFNLIN